ncbi:MAG: tyrosine-protein phosphatase [Acidimicrobiia bacterium]
MAGRHVRLEGSFNLRDIGGYRSSDGRRFRSGCVFRSDELHALTDADVAVVASLGIRVVFDLRNASERVARPSRLPKDVELLERTSPSTTGETRTTEEQIAIGELPVRDDEYFAGVYVGLFDRLAPELRIVLERAVDAPTRPLLFHCAGGKDRTGIVAAVLLGLLGVSDEVILDDYELTSTYFTPRRMETLAAVMAEYGIADERVRPLLEARRPVLSAALRHVHERWGGYEGYAREHLTIRPDQIERLRAALLIPLDEENAPNAAR